MIMHMASGSQGRPCVAICGAFGLCIEEEEFTSFLEKYL